MIKAAEIQRAALDSRRYHRWRYGQALFNELFLRHPEVANALRGSAIDPYYYDNGPVVDAFEALLFELDGKTEAEAVEHIMRKQANG